MDKEKLKLLKSLRLFERIPEAQLATLGNYLRPKALVNGDVVFEEGSKGDSLFFVALGHIRISKKLAGGTVKDLAILGPGDCFGEMALMEESPRSARATAQDDTVVFQLARQDLDKWLKAHPELMVQFFAELVEVQSHRLRRTSNELALLSDLSTLLLETHPSGKALLAKVLGRVVPHLEGTWAAAAYLYNLYNDEMDFIVSHGDFDFKSLEKSLPAMTEAKSSWITPRAYYVSLPGDKRPLGYLVFCTQTTIDEESRNEFGRTLTTAGRLLTSALENINFRNEETLRARLKATHSTYGTGL